MTDHLYASLAEFKLELWPTGSNPDDLDDSTLIEILEATSRWIDYYTGTRFYCATADETRYFTATEHGRIFTDDIVSITSIGSDDGSRVWNTVWDTDDYDLMPAGAVEGVTPYRWIETSPYGSYSFPYYRNGVKITGRFGYCEFENVPALIKRATLIQATRLYKRKDAPFGVVSNPLGGEMRMIHEMDVDVERMLRPFRRIF